MTYPKGTTKEQWDRYHEDMKRHYGYYDAIKPERFEYETEAAYKAALSDWEMNRTCTAPNKPGYVIANND